MIGPAPPCELLPSGESLAMTTRWANSLQVYERRMNRHHSTPDASAELQPWADLLGQLSQGAVNLTIGLISGSRWPNERAALDRLAQAGLGMASAGSGQSQGLLIRLNMGNEPVPKRQLRSARAGDAAPTPALSPLGNWRDISIAMPISTTAPKNLERLPRWLSTWKREYARILLDLGPIDQPVCRALGRYCDSCLLLLGPETCASPTWLKRHIDHLSQCDAHLCGSMVVSSRAAG